MCLTRQEERLGQYFWGRVEATKSVFLFVFLHSDDCCTSVRGVELGLAGNVAKGPDMGVVSTRGVSISDCGSGSGSMKVE